MRKSFYTLAPAALLMMAAMVPAQAAGSNGIITISGNVSKATCDVVMSTPALNIGNFVATDFSTAKTPVAGSKNDFKVELNNCSDPAAGDTTGIASLIVTAPTLTLHDDMFNTESTSDVGIMLSKKGETTYISNKEAVKLAEFDASATPTPDPATGAKFDKLSQEFTVGLASVVANTAKSGSIVTPITFQFDYN
ncbi:type 1 fimbrial protein [Enterobacter sp. Ap-1006]|uniref:fimbrial protein n=1 Tax=Enterobacter sp. Ap-1006 TaxID=2608345 RepID=UPI00141DE009|nr:fimbrial protein [Enterobacter sp. Ap-1006]NIF47403.1 type 1 fimbrial protein [Enterobacter sp. Ap-1006]